MAAVERLMGVGQTAEVAKRTGFFIETLGGGTLQGPGNFQVMATTSVTINLGSSFDIGDVVMVAAVGVTVQVAPDAGSRLNAKTTAQSFVVSAGQGNIFFRHSPTQWLMIRSTA